MNDARRPRWWILEVLAVIMGVVLLVAGRFPVAPIWHKVASLIIMGVLYGLIALWVHVNSAALAWWEQDDDEGDIPVQRTWIRNEPLEEEEEATDQP